MTDLDRQVADRRGWTLVPRQPKKYICPETGESRYDWQDEYWIDANGKRAFIANYSPETNLLQAFALWDEARPEGWWLEVKQGVLEWIVKASSHAGAVGITRIGPFSDLPRAITTAWLEAKEGK